MGSVRRKLGALVAAAGLAGGLVALSASPAAAAGVTFWVDPAAASGGPGTGCGADAAYTTPAAAITAAGANDIIEICAGTYAGFTIPTGKAGLTVNGAKAGVPAGTQAMPGRGTDESVIEGSVVNASSANVTIDGLWVNSGAVHGIRQQALQPITVKNNVVRGTPGTPGGPSTQNGLFLGTLNGVTASGNNIDGYRYGIHTTTQLTNAASTLSGNYISRSGVSSIQVASTAQTLSITGNEINTGSSGIILPINANVSITGNTITGLTGTGVYLAANGVRYGGTITGNTITGNTTGVYVEAKSATLPVEATPIDLTGNTISGNTGYGANGTSGSTGAYPVDATCTWWGSTKGPRTSITEPAGAGNRVNTTTADVTFLPWRMGAAFDAACTGGTLSPTAAFTYGTNSFDPYAVDFDGSSSSDPDGNVVSWDWDFGDGNTGTGVNASHSYSGPGSYTVELTVTDNHGHTNSTQQTVDVAVAAARIRGTVTSTDGGAPIAGIQVRLYKGPGYTTSSATTTDSQGRYSFPNLGAGGDYKLWFRDVSNTSWVSEYYDDASTLAAATPVSVTTNEQVVVNAQLVPKTPTPPVQRGTVQGRVTSTVDGQPIAGIQVRLYAGPGYTSSAATTTDVNGNYSFPNRLAGDYKIWFRDLSNTAWISEYYNDQTSLGAADVVTLPGGGSVTADGQLAPKGSGPTTGSITGTVTDNFGEPLSGIQVRVYREGFSGSFATFTDSEGNYSVPNRPAGTYRIWFRDMTNVNYISEYYDDQPTLEDATPLVLSGGGSLVADAELTRVVANS